MNSSETAASRTPAAGEDPLFLDYTNPIEATGHLEVTVARTRSLTAVLESVGPAPVAEDEVHDLICRVSDAVAPGDEQRASHMRRVAQYAQVLAETVGVGKRTAEQISVAGALYDIGKVGVSDEILLKPGPLLEPERICMRRHARIGYQLLMKSDSPSLHFAADVAWSHHEWWDGSGYPRGLRGEETSLAGRIVGMVDFYDALTSERVYRTARSVGEAVETMQEMRGRRFEPSMVDAFLSQIDEIVAIGASAEQSSDSPLRVVVVDDHPIFADSLVRMLSSHSGLDIIGMAGDVSTAVAMVKAEHPDLVLMDFELPDGDGPSATEQIKAVVPATRVIMLTMRADDHARTRALAAGCSGFVQKNESVESLLDTILAVGRGEITMEAEELTLLLSRLEPCHRGLGASITPRELDVLQAMADGLVNKEIAQRLGVRLNTVRNHVQNILYKLEVHSQLEAVATGVREGLIGAGRR